MPPTEKPRRFELTAAQKSSIVLLVALTWGTVQLFFFGPDPVALTFISGVILSVPAHAVDRARAAMRAFTEDKP